MIFFTTCFIYFFLQIDKLVMCYISTPHNPVVRFVGDDAIFNWTTSDGKKIYSAKFGIAKDNIPNPKFIDINVYNNIVYFNKGMDPKYRNRVDFIGNLTAGHAWFILKNLTINDTNEYIAVIRDDKSGIFPYTVNLKVIEKEYSFVRPTPSSTPTRTTNTSAAEIPTTLEPTESNSSNDNRSANAVIVTTITCLTVLAMILI